jgi:hypothetical protein
MAFRSTGEEQSALGAPQRASNVALLLVCARGAPSWEDGGDSALVG